MTISSDQPITPSGLHADSASLRTLEDLLENAVRLADAIGLSFPAIRIEEALMLVRAQSGADTTSHAEDTLSFLN